MHPLFAAVRDWEQFGNDLIYAATFGLLGVVMLLLGFKLFEWVTPKLDVEHKLQEGNIAVGIVVGALLLAIGIVVGIAIH